MPLLRFRIPVLITFALALLLSAWFMQRIRLEFSLDAFFPEGDAEMEFYVDFKDSFASQDDPKKREPGPVLVGIYREGGIFAPEHLTKIDTFVSKLRHLPHVKEVSALTTLRDYAYDPFTRGPLPFPLLDRKMSPDSQRLALTSDPRMRDHFISPDGRMTAVMIQPAPLSREAQDTLVDAIIALGKGGGFERVHFVGHFVGQVVLNRVQKAEFALYILLASIVILVCMIILFRRFWGIVTAFVSVMAGMVIFFGVVGFIGEPLDLMGTLFPILLVIVGTSDIVHLLTKYADELDKGEGKEKAMRRTLADIGSATFLTSLTTAVGFGSLYASNMPPIKNFGVMAALGVFLAYLTVMGLGSAMMSFFSSDQLIKRYDGSGRIMRGLYGINRLTIRRPRMVLAGALLVLGLSVWGMSRIDMNMRIIRDLPYNSDLKSDFAAYDSTMGGVNNVDMAILPQGGRDMYDLEVLHEVQKLQDFMRDETEVRTFYSPATMFSMTNRAWLGADPAAYKLPESQKVLEKQRKLLLRHFKGLGDQIITPDGKKGKLSIRVQDIGSERLSEMYDRIDAWKQTNIDSSLVKFRFTGSRYLIDVNQVNLVWSMMKSLMLAFAIVSLLMAMVFRNLRMLAVSLIPNIIPLFVGAGLMGFLGFAMDPKIAIVFTISFGIAVDDTIHFLAKYRIERLRGSSMDDAIDVTFRETGRAIVVTTLILFSGFLTLLGSQFPPTFVIGLLISMTLLVALFADLFLMPLCIRYLLKK